jgi:isoamylase
MSSGFHRPALTILAVACTMACTPPEDPIPDPPGNGEPAETCPSTRGYPALGAFIEGAGGGAGEDAGEGAGGGARLVARVFSENASHLELHLFAEPLNAPSVLVRPLSYAPDASGVWSVEIPVAELAGAGLSADGPLYYGYRAWGPNWPHDPDWTPGSEAGFLEDVDDDGNRFNPNKLLLDPYALEMSHDPIHPGNLSWRPYLTGAQDRATDTGPLAPKGIVLPREPVPCFEKPERPFRDEIVYEVHLRGLTMRDPSVPENLRGTYAGAALKAPYLADLGVTAVEFLPLHETWNDGNDDIDPPWQGNYWGYATVSFFAADRRYAADKSPGGPTRELQEMIRAFHDHGIKVYVDVVYNHTAEDGAGGADGEISRLVSWRGLDNATYYQLADDARFFHDNTGIGANVNVPHRAVRQMVLDSLSYWTHVIGADGYRFDLASILGNDCERGCFEFVPDDPDGILKRAAAELPARPEDGGAGVDLIAEPWGIGPDTYQLGGYPEGWSEWNDQFRDAIRRKQNLPETEPVTPATLARRIGGSPDLFGPSGRRPQASVNFLVAHDGFTLADLYAYDEKQNDQPWPYGPSDGGSDWNRSWDQGGDPAAQVQAARTGLAILMTSVGVPMITGGDEFLRTQFGNNNAYNIDAEPMWLDWSLVGTNADFHAFARRMLRLRHDHPSLRPVDWPVVAFFRDDGAAADRAYLDDASRHFLGWRVGDLYVAWNAWSEALNVVIPRPEDGRTWHRVADTSAEASAWGNARAPGEADPVGRQYTLPARSVVVLEAR